jgi:hypothetical protein
MVLVGKVNKAGRSHQCARPLCGRVVVRKQHGSGDGQRRAPRAVGEVTAIDTTVLDNVIEDGFIPVLAAVAAGDDGEISTSMRISLQVSWPPPSTRTNASFSPDVDRLYRVHGQTVAHQRDEFGEAER